MPDVNKILQDGEELLWQGRSLITEPLNKTYRPVFVKKLIIGLIVMGILGFLYIRAALSTDAGVKPMVIIALAILCLFSAFQVIYSPRKLRKMIYAATDKRLMIVTPDHVIDVPYGRIHEAVFKTDADGLTSLLCGKDAVKSGPSAWRDLTAFAHVDPNGEAAQSCESFVLYGIDRPDQLKDALTDRIPLGL